MYRLTTDTTHVSSKQHNKCGIHGRNTAQIHNLIKCLRARFNSTNYGEQSLTSRWLFSSLYPLCLSADVWAWNCVCFLDSNPWMPFFCWFRKAQTSCYCSGWSTRRWRTLLGIDVASQPIARLSSFSIRLLNIWQQHELMACCSHNTFNWSVKLLIRNCFNLRLQCCTSCPCPIGWISNFSRCYFREGYGKRLKDQ